MDVRNEGARIAAERVLLKRAYDAPDASDGVRVLVDRLWARGISKTAADLDAWMSELGPSNTLRTQFGHEADHWQVFVAQYRGELLTPMRQSLLAVLQGVASHATVTLVYGARDTKENEAVVLRQYLLQEHARAATGWDIPTKLLVVMAVVAAARPDAVASASGVERFTAPLMVGDEIASARSMLLADGQLQPVSGGWELTARARKYVHELQCAAAPAPT